jgi:hypothetical protein
MAAIVQLSSASMTRAAIANTVMARKWSIPATWLARSGMAPWDCVNAMITAITKPTAKPTGAFRAS